MRSIGTILWTAIALLSGGLPVQARPDLDPSYPIPHVRETQVAGRAQPYAMNYTDQMAQSLGIRDGRWEVFDPGSNHPLMPSLKGGIDSGGPMLRLQWRQ